jgi:hypothetical protein
MSSVTDMMIGMMRLIGLTWARRAQVAAAAAAAVAGLLAACSDPIPDGCNGAATCVSVDIDSGVIQTIDQLELDVSYGALHSTTTIGMIGDNVSVPLTLPLTIDLPGNALIPIELVAAAKLGGAVIGTGTGSTTVQPSTHALLGVLLEAFHPCTEGALYCGGTFDLLRDLQTLYRCTGGVPLFYARCSVGCTLHFQENGLCTGGGGQCRDGGRYCGGHVVDGDPGLLYTCNSSGGVTASQCFHACIIQGDGNDMCS